MPKSDYQRGVRDQYYDRPTTIKDLLNRDYERGRASIKPVSQEQEVDSLIGLIELGFLLFSFLIRPILHLIFVVFFGLLSVYALLSLQFPFATGALPTAVVSAGLGVVLIWRAFRHYPRRFSIFVVLAVALIGLRLYVLYRHGNLYFTEVVATGDTLMTDLVQGFIDLWNDVVIPGIEGLLQELDRG
ncbi:hypothetical protein ACP8Y2_03435 [Herpetosiphon llansteffanensis]